MRISEVLRHKGNKVVLLRPDDTVNDMLAILAEERIGAAVVSPDGGLTVAAWPASGTSSGHCMHVERPSSRSRCAPS